MLFHYSTVLMLELQFESLGLNLIEAKHLSNQSVAMAMQTEAFPSEVVIFICITFNQYFCTTKEILIKDRTVAMATAC